MTRLWLAHGASEGEKEENKLSTDSKTAKQLGDFEDMSQPFASYLGCVLRLAENDRGSMETILIGRVNPALSFVQTDSPIFYRPVFS